MWIVCPLVCTAAQARNNVHGLSACDHSKSKPSNNKAKQKKAYQTLNSTKNNKRIPKPNENQSTQTQTNQTQTTPTPFKNKVKPNQQLLNTKLNQQTTIKNQTKLANHREQMETHEHT